MTHNIFILGVVVMVSCICYVTYVVVTKSVSVLIMQ